MIVFFIYRKHKKCILSGWAMERFHTVICILLLIFRIPYLIPGIAMKRPPLKIRAKAVLLGLPILLGLYAPLAAQNILIDNLSNPEEVSIAMSRKNPLLLVAGSNIDNYYYSHDGGITWVRNTLTSASGVWGDPMVMCDTAGDFYYFHLACPGGQWWDSPNFLDRVVCQKSVDEGITYTGDYYMGQQNAGKIEDKAWACVDPHTNYLYCTWTEDDHYDGIPAGYVVNGQDSSRILFSSSQNGGLTWSPAIPVSSYDGNCVDSDSTDEGAVPCVGPNGEVYVVFSLGNSILFNRSTNHGASWMTQNSLVNSQVGGWDLNVSGFYRTNGMTVSACDLSNSPYHGTIYVNWSDIRNGAGDPDIFICKSTNGGITWSAPVRVNQDTTHTAQFNNWMCVDQKTGYVYVVYLDRSLHPGSDSTDVFLAMSADGGQSFTTQKINTQTFLPDVSVFPGDYINVTGYNGTVHAIWTRVDPGMTSIWTNTSHFTPLGAGAPASYPGDLRLSAPMPNPVSGPTWLQYIAPANETCSMEVWSVTGQHEGNVFTNRTAAPGWQGVSFNPAGLGLQAGTYLLVLQAAAGERAVQRMVYIK